ncbi:MAG: OmpA family protein [Ferruginibacter sp.]
MITFVILLIEMHMAPRFKFSTTLTRLTFGVILMSLLMGVSNKVFSQVSQCKIDALPTIVFQSKSAKLLNSAQTILNTVSEQIKENPLCKIVVASYGANSKDGQQLSWAHVNSVINYFVEKRGIAADRFIFSYGNEGGDPTTVDLRVAAPGEDGPSKVPPPFPGMRTN